MAKTFIVNPKYIGYPTEFLYENDCLERPENCALLTQYIHQINADIRRGDLVSLLPKSKKYRNDFTYIWDGEKVIELDYTIDDYGSVPPEFLVTDTEFSPDYWKNAIAHNGIFHVDPEIMKQSFEVPEEGYLNIQIGETGWRCYIDDHPNTTTDLAMSYPYGAYLNLDPCESRGPTDDWAGPTCYLFQK